MSLTKATFRMLEGASVNVKDYGAVGDGVTDDTDAIQAALDVGKNVLINEGTYLITAHLYFLQDYGTIDGTGELLFNSSVGLNIVNTTDVTVRNIRMRNTSGYSGISIYCGDDFNATKTNTLQEYKNFLVENTRIDRFSSGFVGIEYGMHGIGVKGWLNAYIHNVKILNNTVLGAGTSPDFLTDMNGSDNIYVSAYSSSGSLYPLRDVLIQGNTCRYAGRQNISLASDAGFPITNAIVSDNICQDSTLGGLDLEQAINVTISNNIFIGNGNYKGYWNPDTAATPTSVMRSGIVAHGDSNFKNTISNCNFKDCYYGIGAYNVYMSNCIFHNSIVTRGSLANNTVTASDCIFTCDTDKQLVSLYSGSTVKNSFTNCRFVDSFTGTRTLDLIYSTSTSVEGINSFESCHFKSAATAKSFIYQTKMKLKINSCLVDSPAAQFLELGTTDLNITNSNVITTVLYTIIYAGSETVEIDNCHLTLASICTTTNTQGGISDFTLTNSYLVSTAISEFPVARKIKVSGNRVDASSLTTNVFQCYPQANDNALPTVLTITNNQIVGMASTKKFMAVNAGASANSCIPSVKNNLVSTSDIITISAIYTSKLASGTTLEKEHNYYNILGTTGEDAAVLF